MTRNQVIRLEPTPPPPELDATTFAEKFKKLIELFAITSAELALMTGCSVRAVEERRRKLKDATKRRETPHAKLDQGIDRIYSVATMLQRKYMIEPVNVRAWLIGRSAYLEEQRPADLLREEEFFDLVREAAIAYATGETPAEFLEERSPLPRVASPVEA